MNEYAVIWYEGTDVFRLVDHEGKTKTYTKQQLDAETTVERFLETEEDVDNAENGLRYAISMSLLEDIYGSI